MEYEEKELRTIKPYLGAVLHAFNYIIITPVLIIINDYGVIMVVTKHYRSSQLLIHSDSIYASSLHKW